MVAAGIRRLATMQTYNGSFSMWPYGGTTEPWGTVYATHFLVEAKRAGHDVPQPMLDRALAYIATDAKAKSDYDAYELERVVYSLYVLARAGKADIGTMDYIREHQLSRLAPHSRALLAAAYAATGNPKMIESLAANVRDIDNVERQIKRRQEIDRWTAARQNIWISNLSEAGVLDGVPDRSEHCTGPRGRARSGDPA